MMLEPVNDDWAEAGWGLTWLVQLAGAWVSGTVAAAAVMAFGYWRHRR